MDEETVAAIEARAIETEKRLAATIKTEVAALGAQIDATRAREGKRLRAWIESTPLMASRVFFGVGVVMGAAAMYLYVVRPWS